MMSTEMVKCMACGGLKRVLVGVKPPRPGSRKSVATLATCPRCGGVGTVPSSHFNPDGLLNYEREAIMKQAK